MNNMNSSINKYSKVFITLTVIIVVLLAIFIVYRISQTPNTNDSTSNNTAFNNPLFGEAIENNFTNKITYNDKSLVLPDGYGVTTVYQNSDDATNLCITESESECRIYVVSNGDNTYYISTPTPTRFLNGPVVQVETKVIDFAAQNIELKYDKLLLTSRSNIEENGESTSNDDTTLYLQAYGCEANNFCASTLALDYLDQTINASQIQAFETFLVQLRVE